MKAAIYDPYLDTLGGGEKYTLTVAETMLKLGWQVDIFWSKNPSFIEKAEARFLLDLKNLNIVPDPFSVDSKNPKTKRNNFVSKPNSKNPLTLLSRVQKIKSITSQYDHIFFLSDGSVPFLFGKINTLHFQVPFKKLTVSNKQKALNRLRLKKIKNIVCNSEFTKKLIDKTYGVKSSVLYPPIDTDNFKPAAKKENIILSVARFDNIMNTKRQDVLIKVFKEITDRYKPGWKLVLAGSSIKEPEANNYLINLKSQAQGYPVEFLVNQNFSVIKDLYSKAKIFWHAAGFGVDEEKDPESVEHFGMTTVEAMSSGCVPVAIKKGGVKEVIQNEETGYLWETEKKLTAYTKLLMDSEKIRQEISKRAQERAKDFSKDNFVSHLKSLLISS